MSCPIDIDRPEVATLRNMALLGARKEMCWVVDFGLERKSSSPSRGGDGSLHHRNRRPSPRDCTRRSQRSCGRSRPPHSPPQPRRRVLATASEDIEAAFASLTADPAAAQGRETGRGWSAWWVEEHHVEIFTSGHQGAVSTPTRCPDGHWEARLTRWQDIHDLWTAIAAEGHDDLLGAHSASGHEPSQSSAFRRHQSPLT